MRLPVYLDNHATTPLDPRVLEAMMPFFTEHFGNASSKAHEYGWTAEAAVDIARKRIAELVGADAKEIVFTSGATESISLALRGVVDGARSLARDREIHIVTAATEHHAVLDTLKALGRTGVRLTIVPVDSHGRVDVDALERALTEQTLLVSVMWANNEIGTIAPMREISELCRSRGILFHSDATQAVGRVSVNVRSVPVDLLSFSAHKMHGPKGIGALYISTKTPRIPLVPQVVGGGQESGVRSGTLNVPAIVGFGRAAHIASVEMEDEAKRVSQLRNLLEEKLAEAYPEMKVNGHPMLRLPNNSSITFAGKRADAMIMAMKDVAVSTGSACSSTSPEPSHVLQAIGCSPADIKSTLRFGLGRFTTEEEIAYAARRVVEVAQGLRHQAAFVHTIGTT